MVVLSWGSSNRWKIPGETGSAKNLFRKRVWPERRLEPDSAAGKIRTAAWPDRVPRFHSRIDLAGRKFNHVSVWKISAKRLPVRPACREPHPMDGFGSRQRIQVR
jgi:hypothetical protein